MSNVQTASRLSSPSAVIPAILTIDVDQFVKELNFAATRVGAVHLDVIDGSFCPGRTIPIESWPTLKISYSEAHLMVARPIEQLELVATKKITRAIVHIESNFDPQELQRQARQLDLLLGWAVNPDTDLDRLRPLYEISSYIQVMGVHPGASGQPMISTTALAVAYLKRIPSRRLIISVDGGVTEQTIGPLLKAGAAYCITDHAIFGSDTWLENFEQLITLTHPL